jgi:hypothetical protein
MMLSILYVSESKQLAETISFFGDFADVLLSGETLTSYTVTVNLVSGVDPNPSNMLYEGIEVHNNTYIEQRIRLGIVGCIYDIVFTVGTNLSNEYIKFTRLVILPNYLPANSQYTNAWLTSWRYPYNFLDSMQGAVDVTAGSLWYQPSYAEGMQGGITIITGNLSQGSVNYTYVPEGMQGSVSVTSGILTQVVVTYNAVQEAIQGGVAILYGNLYQSQVSFTNPPDSMQGGVIIVSGTLT